MNQFRPKISSKKTNFKLILFYLNFFSFYLYHFILINSFSIGLVNCLLPSSTSIHLCRPPSSTTRATVDCCRLPSLATTNCRWWPHRPPRFTTFCYYHLPRLPVFATNGHIIHQCLPPSIAVARPVCHHLSSLAITVFHCLPRPPLSASTDYQRPLMATSSPTVYHCPLLLLAPSAVASHRHFPLAAIARHYCLLDWFFNDVIKEKEV